MKGSLYFRTVFTLADTEVSWSPPSGYFLEVHGHCFVLLDRKLRRAGDVTITASGPVSLMPTPPSRSEKRTVASGVVVSGEPGVVVEVSAGRGRITDYSLTSEIDQWQVWRGERCLTYLIEKPLTDQGRKRLCVVFSALGGEYQFTYNYRSALSKTDSYKVYILDNFGARGSYYYADHRDGSIFRSVQAFLDDLAVELGVEKENTTFLGSSKGGTAAIAHGIAFEAGQILAGAPQTLPGTYLKAAAPEILQFLSGDTSDESVVWLDRLLENLVRQKETFPRIRILVGENDAHLRVHIRPFVKLMNKRDVDVPVLVVQDLTHTDIGRAFGPYAAMLLDSPTTDDLPRIPHKLGRKPGTDEIQLQLWLPLGEEASISVETEKTRCIYESGPSNQSFYRFSAARQEPVRVIISRWRRGDSSAFSNFTTEWLGPAKACRTLNK